MKATGIVRRIDDLGRVVIPKEIRRTMRIREGDPLEIFTDKDGIMLKKYSAISRLAQVAQDFLDAFYGVYGVSGYIFDGESIVAACGKLSSVKDTAIDEEIRSMLSERRAVSFTKDDIPHYVIPIISSSDLVGGLLINGDNLTDGIKKAAELGTKLLTVKTE
ncbi:MAG: AbrB/MazE/SpoVT family DNA-binding domain-containing protein [Clostridia bacterium]|nr:AbrB/MazE/SpoVT family DNA-binding domain-containing protein [Clostridia bacterium]